MTVYLTLSDPSLVIRTSMVGVNAAHEPEARTIWSPAAFGRKFALPVGVSDGRCGCVIVTPSVKWRVSVIVSLTVIVLPTTLRIVKLRPLLRLSVLPLTVIVPPVTKFELVVQSA